MTIRSDDAVPSPEVGAEELVGTIEEVEPHENDPTSDRQVDPWTEVETEFSELGDQLKDTYRRVRSEGGPTEGEVKEAFSTLASAWNQVAASVSSAIQDPEVRQKLKDAGSAFATAVGRTISDLGDELKESSGWEHGPLSSNTAEEE